MNYMQTMKAYDAAFGNPPTTIWVDWPDEVGDNKDEKDDEDEDEDEDMEYGDCG